MVVHLSESAAAMIEGKNFGYLATVSKDGSPHVTAVWVDRDGDYVLVNSVLGRKKVSNVESDPRVSIVVTETANPYRYVIVQGRVVESSTDGADAHIDKLAKKYLGRDTYPWKSPKDKRVILKIEPSKVIESRR